MNKKGRVSMKDYTYMQFINREYSLSHLAFDYEISFYAAVKAGDINEVRKLMLPLDHSKLGHLSDNPVRNMKYHLIITIAMVTRFCIEGGLDPEYAYTISDFYIQKLDRLTQIPDIVKLHQDAIFDFTAKMSEVKKPRTLPKPVIMVMDYVYDNLHSRINLDSMAEHISLSKTYMCSLFKKQTGITIVQYIKNKKIEAAQNMLLSSGYTPVAVSNYLGFSSHSHFIATFKSVTGMTPKQFCTNAFHSWHGNDIEKSHQ